MAEGRGGADQRVVVPRLSDERAGGMPGERALIITAQDAALTALRHRIVSGSLVPGAQIRQELLAGQLGLSVVPVREALKTLEAEGQVVYAPHRGYFVAQLDLRELTEAYRLRELLEDEAVSRAVPVLGRTGVARMRAAAREVEAASRIGDIVAMTAANRRFHFSLFDAAEMPRLSNFVRMLWESTDPYRSMYFSSGENRRVVNEEHRSIMRAISARDVGATLKLLQLHRENAMASLAIALSPKESDPGALAPSRGELPPKTHETYKKLRR